MKDWPLDLQAKAKALLVSYSDIFSKDELDLGTTNLPKHDIKLTDYTPLKLNTGEFLLNTKMADRDKQCSRLGT